MKRLLTSLVFASLSVVLCVAADWTRFRGPEGLGTSDAKNLPTTWSSTENVAWMTKLPGPGGSSPVVVGDRVYVTCYSGYALDQDEPGDMAKLMRHVVCLDRTSGVIAWQKDFAALQPESKYGSGNDGWHGYATSTPAADDKHLFVFFGKSGVFCLDLKDGAEKWRADVGTGVTGWGSGNSLVLFENTVIVNAAIESGTLRALDKATGKEVWNVTMKGMKGARNTPNLVAAPGGATELVVSLPGDPQGKIVGLDPKTGEELWTCRGIPDSGYVCPSVVTHDGVVYAIGGRKNTALAVRAGGRGDVSESHLLWTEGKGSNVASPAYHDGRLYWVHERKGTMLCLDAKTGETIYEERIDPRPGVVYSSITVADGKIYAVSQHDGTFVFAAGPEFRQLAVNKFDDGARANACLAIDRGQILLRDDANIYCLGVK
jgi:outer membrane protein assembly factor BamB